MANKLILLIQMLSRLIEGLNKTISTMKTVKKERKTIDWKIVAQKIAADKKVINEHIEQGGKLQQLEQIKFRKPSDISLS